MKWLTVLTLVVAVALLGVVLTIVLTNDPRIEPVETRIERQLEKDQLQEPVNRLLKSYCKWFPHRPLCL